MTGWGHIFADAWHLLWSGDPYLWQVFGFTLKVAAIATGVGLVLGLPLGLWLGLGRFPGRGLLVSVANAGMGLPPVLVGVFLSLLLFPAAPLGGLRILFTPDAVYLAQAVLALPVVVALTCSAVTSLPDGLIDQARAFGAPWHRRASLALREAWTGIVAATIAAVGTALSEVGAIVLVGGNIHGYDQTLASAALELVNAGRYADAAAVGMLLLGLILLVATMLTGVQHAGAVRRRLGR